MPETDETSFDGGRGIQLPTGAIWFAVLGIILPIFLFGMTTVFFFFKILTSPIANGAIPIWAVLLGGFLVIKFMRGGY